MEAAAKKMRSDDEIIQLFKECVAEVDSQVRLGEVRADTEIADLGLDSVMTMEVIGVLEERLHVRFPDEDLATLRSLKDLSALIRRLS